MENDMITWQDGVGYLPGSDLKFRRNELGMVEILDDEAWQKFYDQTDPGNNCSEGNQVPIETCNMNGDASNTSEGPTTVVNGDESSPSVLTMSCTISLGNGYGGCSDNTCESPEKCTPDSTISSTVTSPKIGKPVEPDDNFPSTSKSAMSKSPMSSKPSTPGSAKKSDAKLGFGGHFSGSPNSHSQQVGSSPGEKKKSPTPSKSPSRSKGVDSEDLTNYKDACSTFTVVSIVDDINSAETQQIDPQLYEMFMGENFKNAAQSSSSSNSRSGSTSPTKNTKPKASAAAGCSKSLPILEPMVTTHDHDNCAASSSTDHGDLMFPKLRKCLSDDEESLPDIPPVGCSFATDVVKTSPAQPPRSPPAPPVLVPIPLPVPAAKAKSPSKNPPKKSPPRGKQDSPVPCSSKQMTPGPSSPSKKRSQNNSASKSRGSQSPSKRPVLEVMKQDLNGAFKCHGDFPSNRADNAGDLADIDPGPPCLRPRSRSRSVSPSFHLAPPSSASDQGNGDASTSLEGIPILKAESSSILDKDIAFCKCCGCFGLSQEFYESVFCTKACGNSYKYHIRSPEGKRRVSQGTPSKLKLSPKLGESSHHRNGESRSNGTESSSSSPADKKKVKRRSNVAPGKSKSKSLNMGKGKVQHSDGPSGAGTNTKVSPRRLPHNSRSTAFNSKDRKRNFPLLLSKRMPGSPERKLESFTKEVQLSPDITMGKTKPTTTKLPTVTSEFVWGKYLAETKSKSAPHRLFRQPAMPPANPFRSGMMLESIDPQHQSLICVATVIDTQGYRLRLRFQGFSEAYDFWANADSLDIFPPGWCQENGLELQPPPGAEDPFNWDDYVRDNELEAAPRDIFAITKEDFTIDSGVKPGMKMEAVDIRNQNLVCVATVAKVMGERILVHFDSWDSLYDYWTDLTSPFIHPVGWCEKNSVKLTPPNYCNADFTWEKYLHDTKSIALPGRLFRPLPPVGFKKGSKIECVDKRNPFLIRVATIAEVKQHNLTIHFDNWSPMYDFPVYELSSDIHPAGWCAHTGHPLQPPPPPDGTWKGPCTVVGCLGLGHIRGPKFLTHNSEKNCPYANHNYKKDWMLADRVTVFERNFGLPHTDNSSCVEAAPKFEMKSQPFQGDKPQPRVSRSTPQPSRHSLPAKMGTVKRKRPSLPKKEIKEEIVIPQKKRRIAATVTPKKKIPIMPQLPSVPPTTAISVDIKPVKVELKTDYDNIINNPDDQKPVGPFEGLLLQPAPRRPDLDQFHPVSHVVTGDPIHQNTRSMASPPIAAVSGYQAVPSTEALVMNAARRRMSFPVTTVTNSLPITTTHTTTDAEVEYPPNYVTSSTSLQSTIGSLDMVTVSSWKVEDLARFISRIPGCEHTATRFLDQLIDGETFMMLNQNDFLNVMGLKLGPSIKLCNVIRMINYNSLAANYK